MKEGPEELKHMDRTYIRNPVDGRYYPPYGGPPLNETEDISARVLEMESYNFRNACDALDLLEKRKRDMLAHKKDHGAFPKGFDMQNLDLEIEKANKRVTSTLSHLNPSNNEPSAEDAALALLGASVLIGGAAYVFWDTVTSAAITAGTFALKLGVAAVGGAVLTAGSYMLSSWAWEKITGEESPVKSGLTAAALFATVVGGVYYANRPDPAMAELQQGFYKAANGSAKVLEWRNGAQASEHRIEGQGCILVLEGRKNSEFARVTNPQYSNHNYPSDSALWIRKTELRPAPECRAF